ncbi:HEAT repeat domain-containing protein [Paraliomyxa miuraensis]|uniref:HEAT repeat domain-containing protein n=1 Tax=Paraliomyxa miuraensis TaxID=376150 RepID=UPI002252323F|nr:HEAT repeat domain-containing protein [Paraliomyxa miuraensis]MCX4245818.1 HEAT repeat domain-containing protein [Paraliomyxa miuraensis]
MYAARRWRWIDGDVRPGLLDRASLGGPWDGACPSCGKDASGHAAWVAVYPRQQRATLMLDASRRGDVIEELTAHLARVRQRGEPVPTWMLGPMPRFVESQVEAHPLGDAPPREETTARRALADLLGSEPARPTPARIEPAASPVRSPLAPEGEDDEATLPPQSLRPNTDPKGIELNSMHLDDDDLDVSGAHALSLEGPLGDDALGDPLDDDLHAGVPQMIGSDSPAPEAPRRPSSIGTYVADLTLDEVVAFRIRVHADALGQWEAARLSARPIHLRGRGYPLVGVRVVASYMGQMGCIDAIVDVGSTLATDVFRRLSDRFEVTLYLEHGSREVERVIRSEGLEPNAALCIESARGILARGEYPPQEFDKARRALEAEPCEVRLAPPDVTIAPGAYQHIIGAREAVAALEHLERVSHKDTLARLLEVDGLPMAEYDAIRRRVLEGSLAHGLCAPRRFWRRLVASGLARDLDDYTMRLCANRAEHEGEEGDLDETAAHEAWLAIHDLCRRKDIPPPPPLRRALDLPEPEPVRPRPPPRRQASGEIRSGEIGSGTPPSSAPITPPAGSLGIRLRNPTQRLRAATEVLQGRASPDDLGQVIDALEAFETSELLALLPDLADLGPRAVPGLVAKLQSESREVRQAAVILLGMSREPEALERLAEHLVWEPTTVWLDVARALGWYGTAAIRSLCQLLRSEAATPREQLAIDRVARALAEIAVAQSDTQTGHDAVRALAEAADPRVSTAARRALANLAEVTTSGAQIRGEIPLNEVTEIRAFARRAYEAIMVPELEVEAEG